MDVFYLYNIINVFKTLDGGGYVSTNEVCHKILILDLRLGSFYVSALHIFIKLMIRIKWDIFRTPNAINPPGPTLILQLIVKIISCFDLIWKKKGKLNFS